METKLPWYVFPIYPGIALACGAKLAEIENMPLLSSYPRYWILSLVFISIVGTGVSIYYGLAGTAQSDLQLIFGAVAITMAMAAILAERGDSQFLKILFWGSYVSLLLLMKSNDWVWELGEAYPVKPVAQMIQQVNPTAKKIYTSFRYHRPSLDFYSERTILPASSDDLQNYWQSDKQPYFLLDESTLQDLKLESIKVVKNASGWSLVTKNTK
jgi:4-amino-4-deoxy-L-arabinose transferase-like glycosyltransferase